jgi:SAM-dependent methyltransferase
MAESDVNDRNAAFWDELCGSNLARELGVEDASPESLARFDDAYFGLYPYLLDYFPPTDVDGRKLLEIGLGYGTLSEALARRGADYYGIDIAAGPVNMVRARLERVPGARPSQVQQGTALALPFEDGSFDEVAAIGCLHHTGDLFGAIAEVRRVLRTGGRLVLMVYNRRSLRRALAAPHQALVRRRDRSGAAVAMRARYDASASGEAAPHTDFVSVGELRGLLHGFGSVRIDRRNIDPLPLPRVAGQSRLALMRTRVDRAIGLDLYAVADK